MNFFKASLYFFDKIILLLFHKKVEKLLIEINDIIIILFLFIENNIK